MEFLVELNKFITTLQSVGEMDNTIGNISNLSTKEKQNLVSAINEINKKYDEIDKGNIDEKIKSVLSLLDNKVNSKDLEAAIRKIITDGNLGGSGGSSESSRIKWLKQTEYSELQFKNQLDPNIEYHITDRPTAYELKLVGAELRLVINGTNVATCNVTTLLNK